MSLALNEYILDDIVNITSNKVDTKNLVLQQYISTENMLPDRKGISLAASMPLGKVNQFLKNDTLFSNIRTYFRKVWFSSFDGGSSPDVLIFRAKDVEVLDPRFLYYLISDQKFIDYSDKTSKGAKMPRGDKSAILNYKIYLPALSIQKRISQILSDLDDKIHLNNQINQTLESIAQAIFKSWFVDFEPVRAKIAAKQEGKDPELAAMCAISGKSEAELEQMAKEDFAELQATAALFPDELVESELGEVPKGWSVQKIKDFGRVICGKTPSKSIAEYYGNDIPFIKIPDMHHDVFVLDSFEKLSEKGSNSQANKILPRGSICVSCIATVGKVIITHQPSQTNQQINSIVPDLPIYTYFLYFLMGEKERLFHDLASGGSATLNMNTSTFSNVDILMPNSKIIEAYDGVVSRIFDEILHNLKLSFLLSDMRDTLLPKLLSGELDVSGLQGEGIDG